MNDDNTIPFPDARMITEAGLDAVLESMEKDPDTNLSSGIYAGIYESMVNLLVIERRIMSRALNTFIMNFEHYEKCMTKTVLILGLIYEHNKTKEMNEKNRTNLKYTGGHKNSGLESA